MVLNNTEKYSDLYQKVISILKEYGIKKIAVFGSYARGEARPNSDLDLLVEFPKGTSLLDHARIQNDLMERTGIKVDLLTEKAISPYLIDRIKNEAIVIYE